MNKKLFTLVYILILTLSHSVYAAVTLPMSGTSNGALPTGATNTQAPINSTTQPTGPIPPGQTPTPTPTQAKPSADTISKESKSIFQTLDPRTKKCNFVSKKLYQPFSEIDKTFPGANSILKMDKNGCVDVSSATENIVKLLFTTAITVIIILTVVMISVSGIQYMTEEAVGKKGEAKKRLTNSIIALGLGLLSYTIMYTINKQLVEFSFDPGSIDYTGAVEGGISDANKAASSTSNYYANIAGIEATSYVDPRSSNLSYNQSTGGWTNPYSVGSGGGWNENIAEQWVRSLPNGSRSTDGRLVVTVYSATKDKITDTNTAQKRGNASNLLREGSVALSPDLISKYKPSTGQLVLINNTPIGYYEDATASVYAGMVFNNTVDIYDENGTLGSSSILKNIPAGQWSISFGSARNQIPNF